MVFFAGAFSAVAASVFFSETAEEVAREAMFVVSRLVLFLNGLYSSSLREPKKHYASSRSLFPINAAQEAVLRSVST